MKILMIYYLSTYFWVNLHQNTIFPWPMYSHIFYKTVYIFFDMLHVAFLASLNTLAIYFKMYFAPIICLRNGSCPLRADNWPGTTRFKAKTLQ